nr:PREDICTED: zinc finger protein 17-like [Linepithema humile]
MICRLLYGNYGNYAIGLYDSTKPDSVFMHEDNRAEDQSAGHVLDSAGVPEQIRGGYRASQSIIRIRRRRSGRRNHVCPKCGNGYLALKSLRRHLTYECGLKPRFKCPYCETRSKQRGHVSQHIHVKIIKLETSIENLCAVVMEESHFDYDTKKSLGPRRRRNGPERHTCSRCSKSYVHAWHLNRHTKFECGQEPRVQCPYCSAKMKQRGHVYRHIRQCHRGLLKLRTNLSKSSEPENTVFPIMLPKKEPEVAPVAPVAPFSRIRVEYRCDRCGKIYKYRYTLLRHKHNECGQEPKFQCPYCPLKTKQRGHVYRHIRRCHRGSLKSRSNLSKSLQPENTIFPSMLPIKDLAVLAPFWTIKPREFPFRCERCGKGYQHRGTLLRHTRHECGKEPQFKCPYCPHKTKQRGNLYQHIRTNHPGKSVFSSNI